MNKEIDSICNQIGWLERHLFELNFIESPFPDVEKATATIGLMNDVAPQFFIMTRYLLIDAIYMSIARLLDPMNQNGHINLSLETIISKHTPVVEKQLALNRLQEIRSRFEDGRIIRNRLLAHPDHRTVLNYPNSIAPISLEELGQICVEIVILVQTYIPNHSLPNVHPRLDRNWHGIKMLVGRLKSTMNDSDGH